jgi:natural product biosynthesis luciferase-like monooxygenase protein
MTGSAREALAHEDVLVPERIDNFLDVLRFRAAGTGGRLHFLDSRGSVERTIDARELLELAFGLARTLDHLSPGDRVALLHEPGPDFVVAFFGALVRGLVPVPLYPPEPVNVKSTARRLVTILRDCQARAILTTDRGVESLPAHLSEISGDLSVPLRSTSRVEPEPDDGRPAPRGEDTAFLQYTSGSTSVPRGARVSHANLVANSRWIQSVYGNTPGTQGVSWLPPYHDMGLIGGVLQPVFAGFDAYLLSPLAFVRRPLLWLRVIARVRARVSGAPNFAYDLAARRADPASLEGLDLSCWEAAFCGAEPVRASTLRRFAEVFAPAGFRESAFAPCYGLAEATLIVSGRPRGSGLRTLIVDKESLERLEVVEASADSAGAEIVSCGPPAGDTRVRTVDPVTGADTTGVGEVVVQSASVAQGYHGEDARSREVFRDDGLWTGDLGFLHGGELYLVGRSKEVVIVRGRNYHPQDLEETIGEDVPELRPGRIVVGTLEFGSDSDAIVIAEPRQADADLSRLIFEMQSSVRQRHGIPIEAVLVPSGTIGRTSSGKLQRRAAVEALVRGDIVPLASSSDAAGRSRADAAPTEQPQPALEVEQILERMARELALILRMRVEDLDVDVPITQLGFDSLTATDLRVEISGTFGVDVSMATLAGGPTLRALSEAIARARAAGRVEATLLPAERQGEPAPSGRGPGGAPVTLPEPSLFFFESTASPASGRQRPLYAFLERSVRAADQAGFRAAWLPERHFHEFGAPFPNPAVLAAALATQTSSIGLRAGSVVLPLHHPLRVVEEWAMVDHLSGGRVGISFTSGWNPRDFVLGADRFETRRETLCDEIDRIRSIWRGESLAFVDGTGTPATVAAMPRPVQRELPTWLTCTDRADRFEEAGRRGYHVLTALLFQDVETLASRIETYRRARTAAGHDRGWVTLSIHTYVGEDADEARETVRAPLAAYLESSVRLWSSQSAALAALAASDRRAALAFAVERYTASSLIGSRDQCRERLARLAQVGVDEVACQIDFGVASDSALAGLDRLAGLWGE